MTGAKYVEAYAGVEDKNGVKVKDWAIQAEPGFVRCSACPGVKLTMLKGKGSLTQRSESGKHKGNVGDKKKATQLTVAVLFETSRKSGDADERRELENQISDLEIALVMWLLRHGVPFSSGGVDCLTEILKARIKDSKIVQGLKLSRKKASYIAEGGLGKLYAEETIEKLRTCDAFGIAVDESEVNKRSELEICCNISSGSGVKSRHYKCVDLQAGDAETICNTLIGEMVEDKIPYKEKMLSLDLD